MERTEFIELPTVWLTYLRHHHRLQTQQSKVTIEEASFFLSCWMNLFEVAKCTWSFCTDCKVKKRFVLKLCPVSTAVCFAQLGSLSGRLSKGCISSCLMRWLFNILQTNTKEDHCNNFVKCPHWFSRWGEKSSREVNFFTNTFKVSRERSLGDFENFQKW